MEILLWVVAIGLTVGGAAYVSRIFDSIPGKIFAGLLGAVIGFLVFLGLVFAGCLLILHKENR